jgi:hypothetical protein
LSPERPKQKKAASKWQGSGILFIREHFNRLAESEKPQLEAGFSSRNYRDDGEFNRSSRLQQLIDPAALAWHLFHFPLRPPGRKSCHIEICHLSFFSFSCLLIQNIFHYLILPGWLFASFLLIEFNLVFSCQRFFFQHLLKPFY